MHGEDFPTLSPTLENTETPPHAWGRPHNTVLTGNTTGNTPTCMGKTMNSKKSGKGVEKHPHMHGEDARGLLPLQSLVETPPHAWGRLRFYEYFLCLFRNTPTCMGKTLSETTRSGISGKHPHMHGEDDLTQLISSLIVETPPHAWGRLLLTD